MVHVMTLQTIDELEGLASKSKEAREEAMRVLLEWSERRIALEDERDDLIRRALLAGIPVRRIHAVTGMARSTIYKVREGTGSDRRIYVRAGGN